MTNSILYDGSNAGEVFSFVTGQPVSNYVTNGADFSFQIPSNDEKGFTELTIKVGQTISKTFTIN